MLLLVSTESEEILELPTHDTTPACKKGFFYGFDTFRTCFQSVLVDVNIASWFEMASEES